MSKNFNPKKYQDKKRIYVAIPNYNGVSKLYIWNPKGKTYLPPQSGKMYLARRYEFDLNGKRTRVTKFFDTLEDARSWQYEMQNDPSLQKQSEQQEIAGVQRKSGYLFVSLFEDFKKHRFPLLRQGSKDIYLKHISSLRFFFNYDVSEITPALVDQWFDWLKSDEKLKSYQSTRVSFAKEVDSLKSILNWHINNRDDANLVLPFKDRHKEMMCLKPKTSSRSSYMTDEEADLWFSKLQEISPGLHPAAITQVNQLLRVSEVMAMKWDHLDLKNGFYRICEHVVWSRKKGREIEIVSGAKNMAEGDSYQMPLRAITLKALEDLRKSASCELIFHNRGNVWTYRQIQYAYNKAFKMAKLPYTSTHVCRHTGATKFLDETNGDYLALQQMGNWSDLKQALHYGKTLKNRARKAIEKADKRGQVAYLKAVN